MGRWVRSRGWFRVHPRAADGLLAAGVFALALVVGPDGPARLHTITGAEVALLVLSCLALVVRRQYPIPVWLFTAFVGFVGLLVVQGPSSVVLPVFIGVYTVATHCSRRVAVIAAVVTAAALILALAIGNSDALTAPSTYAVIAWGGMAAAVGIAARSQRAVVAAAQERALQAEHSRDEQARQAVTQERLRIARELHDVVAHHIAAINVQAGVAQHLLRDDPGAAAEALGHVRDSGRLVLSEMTTILGLLRSPDERLATASAGGVEQLDALIDSARRGGVQVTFRCAGEVPTLAPLLDLTVYRVIQEALTNAGKHGAGRVDLEVNYRDEEILIVASNPLSGTPTAGSGLGLIGMRERVAAVGGSLVAGPDGGTFAVRVALPTGRRPTQNP